jgi:hypothetical protein
MPTKQCLNCHSLFNAGTDTDYCNKPGCQEKSPLIPLPPPSPLHTASTAHCSNVSVDIPRFQNAPSAIFPLPDGRRHFIPITTICLQNIEQLPSALQIIISSFLEEKSEWLKFFKKMGLDINHVLSVYLTNPDLYKSLRYHIDRHPLALQQHIRVLTTALCDHLSNTELNSNQKLHLLKEMLGLTEHRRHVYPSSPFSPNKYPIDSYSIKLVSHSRNQEAQKILECKILALGLMIGLAMLTLAIIVPPLTFTSYDSTPYLIIIGLIMFMEIVCVPAGAVNLYNYCFSRTLKFNKADLQHLLGQCGEGSFFAAFRHDTITPPMFQELMALMDIFLHPEKYPDKTPVSQLSFAKKPTCKDGWHNGHTTAAADRCSSCGGSWRNS